MGKFVSQIFPGWSATDNYGFSPLGKIWMVWHPSLLVTVITKSLQMITAEVTLPIAPQSKVVISVVYASNDPTDRKLLWAEVVALATTLELDMKPWLILGDFNQIRDPSEHSLPPTLNMDKRIRDFNDCLSEAKLDDLNYRGTTFTWWNKRKSSPLAKKLDRCMVNDEWYITFPSSVVFFGSPDFSDHAVMALSLEPERIRTKKPFKFYNFLLKNTDFIDIVCASWFSFNVTGSAMFRVSKKLKLLKSVIRDFSKQNYSGIEKKTAAAHERLLLAQATMLSAPTTTNASY